MSDSDGDDATFRSNRTHSGETRAPDVLQVPDEHRYEERSVLGRGGMGEVALVRDHRLERDVAMKRMRAALDDPDDVRRFLREVRVQGQLDHPSVVPVYELARGEDGSPWFTMKRVRGQTLLAVLQLLKEKDAATVARYTRRRLLGIFTTICECIESAHARGVLHRDLKPGNIMLGEFGEVHVLDWGLARVLSAGPESDKRRIVPVTDEAGTQVGMTMGTPGYMSPEQAQGQIDQLDARSDVFALGCILYELLFLAPLRERPTLDARGTSERGASTVEVPPELDAAWKKACAEKPEDRFPSARALAEAIERYLEGERDEERRRQLSEEQVALAAACDVSTNDGRQRALKSLGRALALDASNRHALQRLTDLLATPPVETPPAAAEKLQELWLARARGAANATALRLLSWAGGLMIASVAFVVRSWPLFACVLVLLFAGAGLAWFTGQRMRSETHQWRVGLIGVVTVGVLALALHPLVVVPTLAATHAMLMSSSVSASLRRWVVLASIGAAALPLLLLRFGEYVSVSGGAVVLTSPLINFDSSAAATVLLAFSLVPILTPALLVGRLRDAVSEAERATAIQLASLRQLAPEE